jgi:hypothetical protein
MTDAQSQADAQDPSRNIAEVGVPCAVCRESIKQGAKKCIRCGSALDWRRWLGVSETTLALLVALISVIGSTGPRIIELFTYKHSDLRLVLRPTDYQHLQLDAWNQGNTTSHVISASVSAKTKDGTQIKASQLNTLGSPAVQAGQEILLGFGFTPSEVSTFLSWPHTQIQSATLSVIVEEYKQKPETRTFDVPLDQFVLFCRATEDADTQWRHPGQGIDNRLTSRCVPHPD